MPLYINEAKRMQQLAGIIKEAQVAPEYKQAIEDAIASLTIVNRLALDNVAREAIENTLNILPGIINSENSLMEDESSIDKDIDKSMEAGLSALKDISSLDEIKDKDQPQQINESIVALVGSALLAAPKILSWIGKVINYMASPLTGKDESEVGQKIKHFAHKWEGYYIKAIIAAIKFTKFGKQLWLSADGKKVDEQKLISLAKLLYGVILATAMGNALGTVLSSASPALKAIEGALGGVKAIEIAQIASKIKGQL